MLSWLPLLYITSSNRSGVYCPHGLVIYDTTSCVRGPGYDSWCADASYRTHTNPVVQATKSLVIFKNNVTMELEVPFINNKC